MEQAILYTLGALVVILGIWLMKAEASSPSLPIPADVPPPDDIEVKTEIAHIRKSIERLHEIGTRRDEDSEDAFRDIGRRLDRIERGVERIENHQETEARIGSALARLGGKRDE